MKKFSLATLLSITFATQTFAKESDDDILTGDTRTACEVILCLSSAVGKGISECKAPLRRYFSIKAFKWHKTLTKRRNFLNLCPSANENAKMSALTTVIQHQEYACDAETFNSRTETRTKLVRTQSYIPKFCEDLYNHEFTEYSQIKKPKYTCDANKWYSKSDWNRGYERIVVSRKWNRSTESYDIVYKDVPIKKDCWQ